MSSELKRRGGKKLSVPGTKPPEEKKPSKRVTPERKKYTSAHFSWQQHDIDRINRLLESMGSLPVDATKLIRGSLYLANKKGPKGLIELIVDTELEHRDQPSNIKKRYGLREHEEGRLTSIAAKMEKASGKKMHRNRIVRGGLLIAETMKPRELHEIIKSAEKESILAAFD